MAITPDGEGVIRKLIVDNFADGGSARLDFLSIEYADTIFKVLGEALTIGFVGKVNYRVPYD